MLVYRIESTAGSGAFRSGLARTHDEIADRAGLSTAMQHPSPHSYAEQGSELQTVFSGWHSGGTRGLYFGCRSRPQLRMWFRSPEGRAAMARDGGVMVTYSVPDEHIKRGRYQVAFDMSKAVKVSTVPADQW